MDPDLSVYNWTWSEKTFWYPGCPIPDEPPDPTEGAMVPAVFFGFAVVSVISYWVWWALWGNQPPGAAASDHWLNVMLGLGGLAAVAGVVGGAYLAARYGRRASVSIKAEARPNNSGVLIVARPIVKSVGIFRVRFEEEEGAVVKATEVWIDDDRKVRVEIGERSLGRTGSNSEAFTNDTFVEGSEELQTTVLIPMPPPTARVIGWMVSLEVYARSRFLYDLFRGRRPYWWTDRVFVERPGIPSES